MDWGTKSSILHTKFYGNAIPIILMIKISIYSRNNLHLFHANTYILIVLYKIFEQINEKSRGGINGYFCTKKILHINGNGAFPQLFVWRNDISTAQGKKWWTEVRSHHFFPRAVEISFLHTKSCGNAIPIISMIKISIYFRRNLNLFHANTFIL